jgi:hypothetical protein
MVPYQIKFWAQMLLGIWIGIWIGILICQLLSTIVFNKMLPYDYSELAEAAGWTRSE